MEKIIEEFVSHDYLCKCIDHPLDFVLFGLPAYINLKNQLLDVITNESEQGDFFFEGFSTVLELEYLQSDAFKDAGYGPWSHEPRVLKVIFTKYSSRPDLAGQIYIVGDVTPAFKFTDLKYNLEEVKAHCNKINVTFHEPREQQNPKFSLAFDTEKFEIKEQPINPNALLPESTNLPDTLKLTIDAYNVWWRDTLKVRTNTEISAWLKEESVKRSISHTLKGEPKAGISGVTEKAILTMIRPEKFAINNKIK